MIGLEGLSGWAHKIIFFYFLQKSQKIFKKIQNFRFFNLHFLPLDRNVCCGLGAPLQINKREESEIAKCKRTDKGNSYFPLNLPN